MIELRKQDKEIDIKLNYYKPEGSKVRISLYGEGDLSHHLIEGLFDIVDKLSAMEGCCHLSQEWKKIRDSNVEARMREI